MLTYSPEAAFILTLFELVLSGLPLAVLFWVGFRERARSAVWAALIAGFALLCAAFAAQASSDRLAVSPAGQVDASFGWLLLLADVARVCSSAALGAAHLMRTRRPARLRVFLLACTRDHRCRGRPDPLRIVSDAGQHRTADTAATG